MDLNVCELIKTEGMKAREKRDQMLKAAEEVDDTLSALQLARKVVGALARAFNPALNEDRAPTDNEMRFMWPAEKIPPHHRDAIRAYVNVLGVDMSLDILEDDLDDAEVFFFKINY